MLCPDCSNEIQPGVKVCSNCGKSVSQRFTRQMPSIDGQDACQICGNPVAGKEWCDVCGSTVLAPRPQAIGLKCPICGADLNDGLNCEKCGKLFGASEEEVEQRIQCPGCGGEVALNVDVCQSCGLRIWIDESAEVSKIDRLRCPSCGQDIGENDELCGNCKFQIWVGDDQVRYDRAMKAIEDADSWIRLNLEESGAVMKKAVTSLETAKRSLDEGEADVAWRHAMLASEIAATDARQKSILAEAWRRAEERMQSAEQYGGDLSECKELMDLSLQANTKGDRKVAIRFALRCKILAENLENSLKRAPIGG